MSSAKRAEQLGGRWLGKSLTKVEKKDGQSTEPRCTPDEGNQQKTGWWQRMQFVLVR